MKPEFHEDYQSQHTNPLSPTHADFDWDELDKRLGESELESDETPEQKFTAAMRRIFQWVLNIDYNIKSNELMPDTLIGRRFIALAWVINPALFPDSPSLHKLSRRLGFTAPILAALTGEVCREFGIQNRAQAHAWNRIEKVEEASLTEQHLGDGLI
ncbi:MAG TPA: hypothetical protein VFM25_03925 [Verrucomicrobiae bacterium]|nr:hypothetical protein [Verrucomicrobiae bacterium]